MLYQIIKINRYCRNGMRITHEKTLTKSATLDEVLALAKRQGEDLDEVKADLDYMGCAIIKGYSIFEM